MKLGTLDNPKFLRLARRLGTGKAAAAGHLEALWAFASGQAPAGDVGRWLDEDIEEACFWEGEPGQLVAAFIACGWLDECRRHRLVIHDWADHVSEMVRKRNQRAGITFAVVEPFEPVDQPESGPENESRGVSSERQPVGSRTADSGGRTADHQTPPHPTRPDQTKQESAPSAPAPDGASRASPARKIQKPENFDGLPDARAEIAAWAKRKGYGADVLAAGWDEWSDWEPLKNPTRTPKQWAAAFKRIANGQAASGKVRGGVASTPQWCDCTRAPSTLEIQAGRCGGCRRPFRAQRLARLRAEEQGVA